MTPRLHLAGAADLLGRARRTTLVRLVLACALAGLLAVAVWRSAGRQDAAAASLVEPGAPTVVVLDVSASIRPRVYRQVDETLRRLVASGGRTGLVVFSDIAYELLPVGTSVRELQPVERFYRLLPSTSKGLATVSLGSRRYLRAPWAPTLTQGTRISTGLETALDALEREAGGRGRVVLVSDLGDEVGDLEALGRQIDRYAARRVQLRVVALSPQREDARLFRSLLAEGRGTVAEAAAPGSGSRGGAVSPSARLPAGILVPGILLLVALAVNETLCARLGLRAREVLR